MANTVTVFPTAKLAMGKGQINFSSDTIKILLVKSAISVSSQTYVSDISSSEYQGTGNGGSSNYVRKTLTWTGGQSSTAITLGGSTVSFTADNVVFTGLTINGSDTVAGGVLFKNGANDAASQLICYCSFGTVFTPSGSDLTFQWDPTGIFTY